MQWWWSVVHAAGSFSLPHAHAPLLFALLTIAVAHLLFFFVERLREEWFCPAAGFWRLPNNSNFLNGLLWRVSQGHGLRGVVYVQKCLHDAVGETTTTFGTVMTGKRQGHCSFGAASWYGTVVPSISFRAFGGTRTF
ncbi:hypothetical protein TcCL_Unassigned03246 [Trypanosoma cruzi]|nr:hypothetical protein TcCL_Unassigned03246 [Trypanosoma cruzi]